MMGMVFLEMSDGMWNSIAQMVKFIHASDIHLDSLLKGLQQYEGAPFVRAPQATRHALQNLVELAINEQVHFVVIAGDLYDGDWKDYNTGLFFLLEMSRLRETNIRVCIIAGNHDAASQITRTLAKYCIRIRGSYSPGILWDVMCAKPERRVAVWLQ